MGLFSRKKKVQAPTYTRTATSPAFSIATVMPSPPVSPSLSMYTHTPPTFKPQVTLRVALDPAPLNSEQSTFCVMLDQDADVASLRRAVAEHIGTSSMSLFKVSIPTLAHKQAIEYRQRYSVAVNLLTAFPAFDLDDARQLGPSFGTAWNSSPKVDKADLRLNDWFPDNSQAEIISILVRTSESSSRSRSNPLTFVTHFAPSEQPVASPRLGLTTRSAHRAPTVVVVSPEESVRTLKSAILRADGRRTVDEHLDRVILWKVEMSEDEMIVIGERGGLKNGRMPWPYPPGAPVPVSLSEDTRPISHYFPETTSNARVVSLSVWLDPRATVDMPRPAAAQPNLPAFKYPMDFSDVKETTPAPAPASTRRSRQRPSTAPAVVVTSPGETVRSVPVFGATSLSAGATPTTRPTVRPRVSSPLSAAPQRGLGINLPQSRPPLPGRSTTSWDLATIASASPRGSVSASDCSSLDDNNLPSLSFSQLSLSLDPAESNGPLTPEVKEEAVLDWLAPRTDLKKGTSLRGNTADAGRKFIF